MSNQEYPYKIKFQEYKRFEEKYNMIYRRTWDKTLTTYSKMFDENIEKHIASNLDGYGRFDFALVAAGWTVYERFPFAFAWERKDDIDIGYGTKWMEKKAQIKDIGDLTSKIKKAARFFGASLVGITAINPKWLYKSGFIRPNLVSEAESKKAIREGNVNEQVLDSPIKLPEGIDKAIVIVIEMDGKAISTAPAQPAAAAASLCYSKMAFIISCLGEFIRNLGFKAVQCGNDTALSIPLAIDAGLGALGRNGLLITPEYGSRVRICKIFTNLPLISDSINFEFIQKVQKRCKNCSKCVEACENGAISSENEPGFITPTISNNPGVKKYYINPEKCFEFWIKNSSDCGKCIAVCPFSRIQRFYTPSEFWNE
ncbi:MAG: 4Fe-4S dicluster domain-containing protein [Promethearchaeota archaeon]|nr:MAG: 4Fe-4S dicluster domain-containing protein [Candidatus Lokiarchaeota archaeon]